MTTINNAPLFPSRIFGIFSKEIKKMQSQQKRESNAKTRFYNLILLKQLMELIAYF